MTIFRSTPPVRSDTGRLRQAVSRRMKRTARDAGQAVIMVIGLSVLLMTVGVMLVDQTIQTDPLLQSDSIQHAAYRGLEAGMNAYLSIVNANPNLANCNTSTNGFALCQGARYQTWNLVSNTNGANGTIPEWYLFDNPQPQFNPDGSLATLKVQIVGVAGFPNHYAYQSSVANLAPVNGFLTTLWWSDYEASDPSATDPNYVSHNLCKYDWQTGYTGAGPNCQPVYFGPSDTINGPVFSNDSIYVTGGPNFGAAAPWAAVKTQDPYCIFTDPSCPLGNPSNVGNFAAPPLSADKQPKEPTPALADSMANLAAIAAEAVPNNGCVYYGPTTIVLTGATMTVTSTDTTSVASGCPLNGSGPLPPNGVVSVNDAPGSGVKGANPFDDSAQRGKYAQTCGDYTVNGNKMPCAFGLRSGQQDSEGDVFVSGNLAGNPSSPSVAGQLTIAASNDIIIDGNLTYTDCSGYWSGTPQESACRYRTDNFVKNDALGLIAGHYVEVDHPVYPRNKSALLPNCGSRQVAPPPLCQPVDASGNITIDAAILALTQSFGVNNYASGGKLGDIILYGSLQQEARGAVGLIGYSGFIKYYTWDPRLELVSPPSYLNPGTASYQLNSSGISSSLNYPPLNNVYGVGGTFQCSPQPPLPAPQCPVVPPLPPA